MDELKQIEKVRKLKGVSWNTLAENLPISGNALRIAFTRNSVDEVYLSEIRKVLEINEDEQSVHNLVLKLNKDSGEFNIHPGEVHRIIRFLKTNHDELMKDEIFQLYVEWIHSEIEKKKAKESLRRLIDEQVKLKKG